MTEIRTAERNVKQGWDGSYNRIPGYNQSEGSTSKPKGESEITALLNQVEQQTEELSKQIYALKSRLENVLTGIDGSVDGMVSDRGKNMSPIEVLLSGHLDELKSLSEVLLYVLDNLRV